MEVDGRVQNNPLKGILLMNLAMVLLGGMDGISKTLAPDYSVPQILCVRFLIFCLISRLIWALICKADHTFCWRWMSNRSCEND